jgi:hypothetical protein
VASADDIPLVTMHHKWQYQHEKEPRHYERHVCCLMDNEFTGQWIGHGGQMSCPLDLRMNLLLNPVVGPGACFYTDDLQHDVTEQTKVCMSINIERVCLNMNHNYN